MSKEETKLKYVQQLEENKLDIKKLPAAIKTKANALNALISRYNSNPTEPTQKAIIKQDVELADLIMDYVENDLPDHPEVLIDPPTPNPNPNPAPNPPPAPDPAKLEEERLAKEKAEKDKIASEAAQKEEALEKEVLEIIRANSDVRISRAEMSRITGVAKPADKIKLGKSTFRRVLAGSDYKLD